MTNLRHLILLFLSLGLALATGADVLAAEAAAPTKKKAAIGREERLLTDEQLSGFLFDRIPDYNDADGFFRNSLADDGVTYAYDLLINNNNRFSSELERGREARALYLKLLDADFGNDDNFTLQPERELIKLMRSAGSGSKRQQEIPDHTARQRAMADTIARFNLSPSANGDELFQNDVAIERFFQKRYFLHGLEEEPKHSGPDLETITRTLRLKLNELRVLNFQGASRLALELSPRRFIFSSGDTPVEVATADLAQASIDILPRADAQPDTRFLQARRTKLQRLHDYASKKLAGFRLEGDFAREHHLATERPPSSNDRVVRIKLPGSARPFILAENEWHSLLADFHPDIEPMNSDLTARMKMRYLLEASRRDSLFSDLAYFIDEGTYATQADIERHLLSRIGIHDKYWVSLKSLTSRLENTDSRDERTTAVNLLRWYGFSEHPNHWSLRDQLASKLRRPAYLRALDQSTKRPRRRSALIRRAHENVVGPSRTSSRKVRDLVTAGLLLLASSVTYETGKTGINALPARSGQGLGTSQSQSRGARPPDINDPTDKQQNNPPPDANQQSNPAPFSIVDREVSRDLIPRFFATASVSNFPKDFDLATRLEGVSEPSSVQKVQMRGGNDAFAVHSNATITATAGRVPVLFPYGYQLSSLHVYFAEGIELTRGKDYEVYQLPGTELPYIRVSSQWASDFGVTYKAGFTPLDNSAREQSILRTPVDRVRLLNEIENLKQLGATELASALQGVADSGASLTLGSVASVFPITGTYTYDPESKEEDSSRNPYASYHRFLRTINVDGKKVGRFFYQCTGSNGLEALVLSRVTGPKVEFQEINLLTRSRGKDAIGVDDGHRQTVAIKPGVAGAHVIVDATPGEMDPKYFPLRSPVPKKETRKDDENRHDDAAKFETDFEIQRRTSKKGDGTKRERERLLKIETLSARLAEATHALTQNRDHETLPNLHDSARIPGLRSVAMGRHLLDYAKGSIDARETLVRLVALQNGLRLSGSQTRKTAEELARKMTTYQGAPAAIAKIMKENESELVALMKTIGSDPDRIKGTELAVLGNSAVAAPISRLTKFLGVTKFTPPRVIPREVLSCSALFN